MKKKLLSMALALVMALALLPTTAFAADPTPVTIGNITLSDVIITDEYETAWEVFGEDDTVPEYEFLYNLGDIGFWVEETQEYKRSTFWCYLVPEDAIIWVHRTLEVSECVVYIYSLEEEEGGSPYSRTWKETFLSGIETKPLETGVTEEDIYLTKAFVEDYYEPEFDLLQIVMGDENFYVWFGGPDAESDTTTEPEPTPAFTDVSAGQYYTKPVAWAVETGITTGKTTTKFAPEDYCTHDQILTFLYRAQRDDGTAPSGSDMALAIEWAKEKGMIDDSFDPKADCTRADAVKYIWQAFGSVEAETEASFPDVSADADYAAAVSWAVEHGVAQGYPDGTFGPDVVCNRGIIVTLLHRAYVPGASLND